MRRYIVIDDDPTNNLICRLTIERFRPGAEINLYTNPEDALETFRAETDPEPRIVLLDINMPTMTGWEFLDVFSTFNESVQGRYRIFILSSSFEDYSDKKDLYPFLCGFFSKPLRIEYLEEISNNSKMPLPGL